MLVVTFVRRKMNGSFVLKDHTNKEFSLDPQILREAIRDKRIGVVNLTLDSNGKFKRVKDKDNISGMFVGCKDLSGIPDMPTSKEVTDMTGFFENCKDLSGINVSEYTKKE